MSLFQFVFSFLFSRNWHSGQMEPSFPKIALFCAALFLILLGVLMASILQAPIEYTVFQK